ncbi:PilZ domain-containing protein [Reinekea sp.]|uniref:PilZ domain-containing protein n=1 Tax=Reinekea sp. TaxID=1970455 RepID=UPI0039894B43
MTLIADDNSQILCSCRNISSTGAFLSVVDSEPALYVGMSLQTKMLKKGQLTNVRLIVERIQTDGFGVRFV